MYVCVYVRNIGYTEGRRMQTKILYLNIINPMIFKHTQNQQINMYKHVNKC